MKSIFIKYEYVCVLKLNKLLCAPVYDCMVNIYSAEITLTDVSKHFQIMIKLIYEPQVLPKFIKRYYLDFDIFYTHSMQMYDKFILQKLFCIKF